MRTTLGALMESRLRYRGRIPPTTRIGTQDPATLNTYKLKKLPDVFVILCIVLTICLVGTSYYFYRWLPEPVAPTNPNHFSATRARKHMEDIVSLGVRNVGSQANEILAKNLLIQKIKAIQALASQKVEVELSVQTISGGYYLEFLGGMTHIYHNVSNVIVRVAKRGSSSEHAFLINAHYDSSIGAVSASDDAVSCGTMLEVLQTLTADPAPFLPVYDVIFLFNGAEETVLQASHGFVTQHPWAKKVKAFVNLEAAGAGGREIVFQSGPENPWLIGIYAKVAPYPYGSVIAEDLFQSGLIPSDTDFRIFRDFGQFPGIDAAYYSNGYVYHTEYDIPSAIPDACIQRAGDNMGALVRGVATSPLLAHPGEYRHGKVVFFDFLGLFMVVYPERLGVIINAIFVLASFCYLFAEVKWSGLSCGLIAAGLVAVLLSWLAAMCINLVTAMGLSLLGRSMSWFSRPLLLFPLYIGPAILAVAGVHHCWQVKTPHTSQALLEKASFLGTLLLWTLALAILTAFRVPSAFVCLLWVWSPLVSRLLLWEAGLRLRLLPQNVAFVLSTMVGVAIPSLLLVQLDVAMVEIFIPITGRSGTILPPEIPIGLLCVVILFITVPYVITSVVHMSSERVRKVGGALIVGGYIVIITLIAMGTVFPYSGSPDPHPKRLFLQHTDHTYYSSDASVIHRSSDVFVLTFDYLELDVISASAPVYRQAEMVECEGAYCGLPFYLPVLHFFRRYWHIVAPPLPVGVHPPLLRISSRMPLPDGTTNLTFDAEFPVRVTMCIAPRHGNHLISWSLERFVPPMTSAKGTGDCYFVFYARGLGEGKFSFWLELKGPADVLESDEIGGEDLEIAVFSHNLEPPLSQTPFLGELLHVLPKWVTAISWTTHHTSWLF